MTFKFLRTTAGILSIIFLSQDLAFAAGTSIQIPHQLGVIRSSHQAGPETIIQIEDAHDSFEAQEKISEILELLSKKYDVRHVALEGSSGEIDPSLFKSYPDAPAAERNAHQLVKEGSLNAGELFAATTKETVAVYGAEEKTLYRENLKAFQDLLKIQGKRRSEIEGLEKTARALAERVYNPELRGLFAGLREDSFTKKWERLETLAAEKKIPADNFPHLKRLADCTTLERSISFKEANSERENLLAVLKNRLSESASALLFSQSVAYKKGTLSDAEYHEVLLKTASGQKISLEAYPALQKYTDYAVRFESIDIPSVLAEMEVYEERVRRASLISDDEKLLFEAEKAVLCLTRFLNGSASQKEAEYCRQNLKSSEVLRLSKDIESLAAKYKVPLYGGWDSSTISEVFPCAARFYDLAAKRNEVLIQNTLKRMRKDHRRVAALVTGGFHTAGVSEILKNEHLSQFVILPKIEDASKKRPYLTIFTHKNDKLGLGTAVDIARANPLAKPGDLFKPFIEDLKAKGKEGREKASQWLSNLEKTSKSPRMVRELRATLSGARLADDESAFNELRIDPKVTDISDRLIKGTVLGQIFAADQIFEMEFGSVLGDFEDMIEEDPGQFFEGKSKPSQEDYDRAFVNFLKKRVTSDYAVLQNSYAKSLQKIDKEMEDILSRPLGEFLGLPQGAFERLHNKVWTLFSGFLISKHVAPNEETLRSVLVRDVTASLLGLAFSENRSDRGLLRRIKSFKDYSDEPTRLAFSAKKALFLIRVVVIHDSLKGIAGIDELVSRALLNHGARLAGHTLILPGDRAPREFKELKSLWLWMGSSTKIFLIPYQDKLVLIPDRMTKTDPKDQVTVIPGEEAVIGRSESADLQILGDQQTSRLHAKVQLERSPEGPRILITNLSDKSALTIVEQDGDIAPQPKSKTDPVHFKHDEKELIEGVARLRQLENTYKEQLPYLETGELKFLSGQLESFKTHSSILLRSLAEYPEEKYEVFRKQVHDYSEQALRFSEDVEREMKLWITSLGWYEAVVLAAIAERAANPQCFGFGSSVAVPQVVTTEMARAYLTLQNEGQLDTVWQKLIGETLFPQKGREELINLLNDSYEALHGQEKSAILMRLANRVRPGDWVELREGTLFLKILMRAKRINIERIEKGTVFYRGSDGREGQMTRKDLERRIDQREAKFLAAGQSSGASTKKGARLAEKRDVLSEAVRVAISKRLERSKGMTSSKKKEIALLLKDRTEILQAVVARDSELRELGVEIEDLETRRQNLKKEMQKYLLDTTSSEETDEEFRARHKNAMRLNLINSNRAEAVRNFSEASRQKKNLERRKLAVEKRLDEATRSQWRGWSGARVYEIEHSVRGARLADVTMEDIAARLVELARESAGLDETEVSLRSAEAEGIAFMLAKDDTRKVVSLIKSKEQASVLQKSPLKDFWFRLNQRSEGYVRSKKVLTVDDIVHQLANLLIDRQAPKAQRAAQADGILWALHPEDAPAVARSLVDEFIVDPDLENVDVWVRKTLGARLAEETARQKIEGLINQSFTDEQWESLQKENAGKGVNKFFQKLNVKPKIQLQKGQAEVISGILQEEKKRKVVVLSVAPKSQPVDAQLSDLKRWFDEKFHPLLTDIWLKAGAGQIRGGEVADIVTQAIKTVDSDYVMPRVIPDDEVLADRDKFYLIFIKAILPFFIQRRLYVGRPSTALTIQMINEGRMPLISAPIVATREAATPDDQKVTIYSVFDPPRGEELEGFFGGAQTSQDRYIIEPVSEIKQGNYMLTVTKLQAKKIDLWRELWKLVRKRAYVPSDMRSNPISWCDFHFFGPLEREEAYKRHAATTMTEEYNHFDAFHFVFSYNRSKGVPRESVEDDLGVVALTLLRDRDKEGLPIDNPYRRQVLAEPEGKSRDIMALAVVELEARLKELSLGSESFNPYPLYPLTAYLAASKSGGVYAIAAIFLAQALGGEWNVTTRPQVLEQYLFQRILSGDPRQLNPVIRSAAQSAYAKYFWTTEERRKMISGARLAGKKGSFADELVTKAHETLLEAGYYEIRGGVKKARFLKVEEERVLFAKKDTQARNILIASQIQSLVGITLRWHNRYREIDYEDYYDAALDALMLALDKFDLERGNRFSTVSTAYMNNAIRSLLRRHNQKQSKARRGTLSFDTVGDVPDNRPLPFESENGEIVLTRNEKARLSRAIASLPFNDRKILEFLKKGRNNAQIASQLGVTREAVRTRKRRIFDGLRMRVYGASPGESKTAYAERVSSEDVKTVRDYLRRTPLEENGVLFFHERQVLELRFPPNGGWSSRKDVSRKLRLPMRSLVRAEKSGLDKIRIMMNEEAGWKLIEGDGPRTLTSVLAPSGARLAGKSESRKGPAAALFEAERLKAEIVELERKYEQLMGELKSAPTGGTARLSSLGQEMDHWENQLLEAYGRISKKAVEKRRSLFYAQNAETVEALQDDLLKEITAFRERSGARLAEENLNVKAQEELQTWAEAKGAEAGLLLSAISDENFSFEKISDAEKEAIWEDLLELLPRIAPKSIEGELAASRNPKRVMRKLKLHLFHPSFGDPLRDLSVESPKAPRAAVWTLDMITSDPFFFDTLEDRDQKIKGKMTIEDFVVVPGKINLKDALDDRYETFKSRFPDTRILEIGEGGSLDSVYSRLGGRFERAHVLFINRSGEAQLKQTSPKDESLKLLVLEGPYALTLDKVAVRILALGDKASELVIKGLKRRGNVFIFSPLAPVDFEKHLKRFYETLKQVTQSA